MEGAQGLLYSISAVPGCFDHRSLHTDAHQCQSAVMPCLKQLCHSGMGGRPLSQRYSAGLHGRGFSCCSCGDVCRSRGSRCAGAQPAAAEQQSSCPMLATMPYLCARSTCSSDHSIAAQIEAAGRELHTGFILLGLGFSLWGISMGMGMSGSEAILADSIPTGES